MDIRKILLQEYGKRGISKIVDYVGVNKDRFNQLINIYLEGPFRLTQKAAWPLSYCVQNHPELIYPHFGKILRFLKKPGIHDAVKRNTMRFLQFIKIPSKYRGEVANTAFGYLQDNTEAVAIRVFSMTVLANIAQEEPDFKKELKIVIEDHLPYAKPAFRSRAKKVLSQIDKS